MFKVDAAGKFTVLYQFKGGTSDGKLPESGVILDPAGNLYGVTRTGGKPIVGGGAGVIFKVDPAGNETVLHRFAGGLDGDSPTSLIRGADGNLYGTTGFGGAKTCPDGCGVVFKLTP